MAVAFTGREGLLLEQARDLLAQSATFQAWVGAEAAAEAEASIALHQYEFTATDPRPFAWIWHGEAWVWEGLPLDFAEGGEAADLNLVVEALAVNHEGDDPMDPFARFLNQVDAIRDEMAALACQDGNLVIRAFRRVAPAERHRQNVDQAGTAFQDFFLYRMKLEVAT